MTDNCANCPFVSVVIPFYSNVQWLFEAVDSVLKQDYVDYEIIVVNDGAEENIRGFLDKYGDKIKYFHKENGGAASARNFGIRNASGEFIAFLDSDDIWKPNKLSMQISEMISFNAVWSYSDYEYFGENTKTTERKMLSGMNTDLYLGVSPYIGTPTVIVKRKVLIENNNLFCEDLKYGEDSVLWAQLIDRYPILYVSENLVKVRIRGANAGLRAAAQMMARVKNYDRCVELIPNYKKKRSFVYKIAVFLCRFGCLFVNEGNEKKKISEFIAKIFYVCPYVLFKIERAREKIQKADRIGEEVK